MLETIFFQAPDLFRCGKAFLLPFMQAVQDQICLSCIVYLIRKDPSLFQLLFLFIRRQCHFPAKSRDITGQIFRLYAHLKL